MTAQGAAEANTYGPAYSLLLGELVEELKRSGDLGRQARRIANARIDGMRRGLLAILRVEHFMTEDYAASVILAHAGTYGGSEGQ
ncbi:hypothetical protein ABZ791_10845 [Streptomyces huasconensis]|uniref:Uncharacterized protein n=1 Tax=Streptomyces huasconensis TaxID=1854574 RepID=A0ABV3MA31_9ACTN